VSTVPDEVDLVLNDLRNALAFCNAATRPGAPHTFRVSAARVLHRALKRVAESEELWSELTARIVGPDGTMPGHEIHYGSVDMTALLERLRDLFAVQQVVLLQATGYKSPPPPPVDEFVENMRKHLMLPTVSGPADIDHLWGRLRDFVTELGERAPQSEPRALRRWLVRGQEVAARLFPLRPEKLTVGVSGGLPSAEVEFGRRSSEGTAAIAYELRLSPESVEALARGIAVEILGRQLDHDARVEALGTTWGADARNPVIEMVRASVGTLSETVGDGTANADQYFRNRLPLSGMQAAIPGPPRPTEPDPQMNHAPQRDPMEA